MEKQEIDDLAEGVARTHMAVMAYNLALSTAGLNEEQIAVSEKRNRDHLAATTTFPGVEPSLADHISDECVRALERLQADARSTREAVRRAAGL